MHNSYKNLSGIDTGNKVTVLQARKILGNEATKLSDEEIRTTLAAYSALASLLVKHGQVLKNSQYIN